MSRLTTIGIASAVALLVLLAGCSSTVPQPRAGAAWGEAVVPNSPDLSVTVQVRALGADDYADTIEVLPGDIVEVRVVTKNVGDELVHRVAVAVSPAPERSTTDRPDVYETQPETVAAVSIGSASDAVALDDIIDTVHGAQTGDWEPGAGYEVTYRLKISATLDCSTAPTVWARALSADGERTWGYSRLTMAAECVSADG
ncbi:hypothetical protein [Herbiconiux sp. VKM Ac-2851]|uniref:hypothetical protein n=1 Tax=Herbiconiux sp. VKM Ac-2851 TaxID=2739025 RepID=UPI001566A838|nr:hypothetical protein [Herbiconiux sp. VKM Ac-2851]NQX34713.1 hypothetical protein [Herbiconiux sp. VKM Ac-2851]